VLDDPWAVSGVATSSETAPEVARINKMRMFIANGTHQNIDFQYRLPEYKTYRMQTIPIGGQIRISGELNEKQIDIIAQFHASYGMVRSNELSTFSGYYIPYIYSIDEPISEETIVELIVHNREVNKVNGEKLRAEAAVAVNAMIEENAGEKLTSFEFEITEKPMKDRDPTIAEKIVITRDKEKGAPQGPPKSPISAITDFMRPKSKKSIF
jgi:hypothetical protein